MSYDHTCGTVCGLGAGGFSCAICAHRGAVCVALMASMSWSAVWISLACLACSLAGTPLAGATAEGMVLSFRVCEV